MGSWRGNSTMSYSTANGAENWGSVRLECDDDLTVDGAYVRNVGMGIEGRPVEGSSTSKSARRASAMSWSSGKATVVGTSVSNTKTRQPSATLHPTPGPSEADENYGMAQYHTAEEEEQRRSSQVSTTMALLQTFHAHTLFQLSVLEELLARQGALPPASGGPIGERLISLSPKDIYAFELGPLSSIDAKYLDWLVQEYGGDGIRVVMKRGWKDILAAIFGYG